jgi:hypothetical protein
MPTYDPITFVIAYNPSGPTAPVPSRFGIQLDFAGNAHIIDLSGATWSGFIAAYTGAGPVVGAVQFSNSMIFALGLDVPPQIFKQDGSLAQLVNTFQSSTNFPPWLPSTQYPRGAHIIAPSGGVEYIFKAINGGTSGTTAPTFPAALRATVVDNGVTWKNKGTAANGAAGNITGAGFVFNHENSLWIWGTAPNYNGSAIDGPDSLRQSDNGDPTSFDPTFQDFVGEGDGQMPMGGGPWTQLEVGIPASPQLVLFKTKSTYSVLGSFPDVSIQQIPDGVGCCAANTVQFVPGIGMMRLSPQGVAVFSGTRDVVDQYTDPIRHYLWPASGDADINGVDWNNIQRASSAQTVSPPGYLLLVPLIGSGGALVRGFHFDRLLKAWTIIDFPPSMQLAAGYYEQATQRQTSTFVAGFSDGILRQIFAGDEFWDTEPTDPIDVSFRMAGVGAPGTPIYLRRTIFRAALRGTTAQLLGANILYQNQQGDQRFTGKLLETDAGALTQAIDIDMTTLGGAELEYFGAGRMVIQGIEVDYLPKPATRIPG